jgi:hypothetical protein
MRRAGSETAARTTATSTTTTTTIPDPASVGCKKFRDEPLDVVSMMVLSRDQRIVAAAKAYRDATAIGERLSGDFSRAVQEIVEACTAAGYLP